MNLYTVGYKKYNEAHSLIIVASTPHKALDGAKAEMKKTWSSSFEIVSLEKVQTVDRIQM